MDELELPEDKMDIAEARIGWAASFLTDWLIPLLQDDRIHHPDQIIRLREEFTPPERNGTDFTINDVWRAALRWHKYNKQYLRDHPGAAIENGDELRQALELLDELVHKPPTPDDSSPNETSN